jgi:DNA invertase Pin-like site-specific DNA recombinase
VSSAAPHRSELEAAMEFARDGDCLVVTRLDRLARSVADLVRITERLAAKGVTLRVLALSLDTATPTGQLMLNLLSAVAQFERQIMLERQREGIAKAKREGKYKGRAPTARRQATAVVALRAEGVSPGDIGRKLGLARSSVYRVINAAQPRT